MFRKIMDAFKVQDIRRRMFFILMCLIIIRLGCQIPVPGVNRDYFAEWFAAQSGDAFNFFDAFTGGSFSSMSILALSITPYITASIIVQLLTIAIPALEEMQRDGEDGRKKLTAITRYLTVGLSLFESIAMAVGFGNQGLIPDMDFAKAVVVVVSLTAGSSFLMWIGEQITEKGIGNGISMVLLINILSRVPNDLSSLYEQFVKGKTIAHHHRYYRSIGSARSYPERRTEKYSGTVFEENGRKTYGRRSVDTHSAQSQYSRSYPGHLRVIHHVLPVDHCDIQRT